MTDGSGIEKRVNHECAEDTEKGERQLDKDRQDEQDGF